MTQQRLTKSNGEWILKTCQQNSTGTGYIDNAWSYTTSPANEQRRIHEGDWFLYINPNWSSSNKGEYTIDGVTFIPSKRYRYNGTTWEQDNSELHLMESFADSISVAENLPDTGDTNLVVKHLTAAVLEVGKLFANQITLINENNKYGLIKSSDYNEDNINENQTIKTLGQGKSGWAIDGKGQADFYNMYANGGTFTNIQATGGKFNGITADGGTFINIEASGGYTLGHNIYTKTNQPINDNFNEIFEIIKINGTKLCIADVILEKGNKEKYEFSGFYYEKNDDVLTFYLTDNYFNKIWFRWTKSSQKFYSPSYAKCTYINIYF